MTRALLDGRKSMTRRLAWKPARKGDDAGGVNDCIASPWQRVKPGDRLWVREAHLVYPMGGTQVCAYRCTDTSGRRGPWRPSIHMPRWASRLTLIVTAAKIERLQEISETDARAEGILYVPGHGEISPADLAEGYSNYLCCRMGFQVLWDSLHGAGAWEANPAVCAIAFTVHRANIDTLTTEEARGRTE